MSFEVKGIKGMQQRIDRIVRQVPNEAEQALRIEAEVIMTKSKQGYVPVDLGPLRASGHVSDPERRGKDVEVTLSFGGAAAPYALAVHEHPGDYDPPSWEGKGTSFVKGDGNSDVVHFGPGERGPKYLERPLRAAVAGMAERIASKIDAGLAGLLLLGLLALPAAAQVSGISIKAFGAKAWRESVASVAALPASGNILGDLRLVRDNETLYWWTGSAWSSIAGGGGGGGGIIGSLGLTARYIPRAAGTDGVTLEPSDNLFQDEFNNLFLADSSGFRSLCFGTADTVPCLRRNGTTLMLEGKGDAVPREFSMGWVSAFNADNPSSFTGIQLRNGYKICFSDGVDYGRCFERVDSILSVTNGAGGFMGIKVGSVVFTPLASPPYSCDATREGATYYDSTDHDYCDCKGASPAWTTRGAGACS